MSDSDESVPKQSNRMAARRVLLSAAFFIVGVPLALIFWQSWRDRALLTFCKEAQVGMTISSLLELEKRHWIDESELVDARFPDFIDQAHSMSLEFRSQPIDPDFACVITHDGRTVTTVQLLTLEGFVAD